MFSKITFASLGAIALASAGAADYIVEDVPSWRGADGSAHYEWLNFSSADGSPNFLTNEMWPSGNALLFNFSQGAIVSGEGNIYGFGGPLNVHTYVYTDADATNVVFNVATLGSEIDYGTMMLAWNGADGESGMLFGGPSINYWEEVDFGQGTGSLVNASWTWDLSGIDADVRELGIIFQGTGAHMSLDAVSVDVLTAVPAPGAIALLGLAGMAGRRRRH